MHSKRDQNFSLGGRGCDIFRILVFPICSQTVPYDIFSLFLKVPMCFPDVPNSTKNFAKFLFGIDNSGDSLRTLTTRAMRRRASSWDLSSQPTGNAGLALANRVAEYPILPKNYPCKLHNQTKGKATLEGSQGGVFPVFFWCRANQKACDPIGEIKKNTLTYNIDNRQSELFPLPFFVWAGSKYVICPTCAGKAG